MLIPTFEDVLEDQKDLDSLCADRELKTNEIFVGNAFYGNDRIIKEFAGFSEKYSLKFIIPHGVVLSRKFVWDAEVNSKLSSVMCYQENRIDTYKRRMGSGKYVFRGAAPFAYIPQLIDNKKKFKRTGTIFFPAHSTHYLTVEMDYELLAEKLANLEEIYQPVIVCLYWRDYNLGMSKIFESKGLRVVSAGHIYDPQFLFRFYHLCSSREYSACNQIGTHAFYAQYAGCKHFSIDTGNIIMMGENEVIERDLNPDAAKDEKKYTDLFSSPIKDLEKKNDSLEATLSSSFKKTRLGLKALLLKTELIHFGYKASNSRLVTKLRKLI